MVWVAALGCRVRQWQKAGGGAPAWKSSPEGPGEAIFSLWCLENPAKFSHKKPHLPHTDMDRSHYKALHQPDLCPTGFLTGWSL